jgi:hypothetical protein
VHKVERVTPPTHLMEVCSSQESDGSIGSELQRLADLVRCERGDKASLRKWASEDPGA